MKFLVVDDHALIRDSLFSVLTTLRAGAQVLQAADGTQAMRMLQDHPDVDLVLLDLDLPDRDGLAILDEVGARHPTVGVVMLSGNRDSETIRQALARGAQGFIPKTETRRVLTQALELVLAGGVYVPQVALGDRLSSAVAPAPATIEPPPEPAPWSSLGLTDRQLDVLSLLMQGRSNKLICRALGLAEPTVKNHVSAILRALGVSSRTEAVLSVTRRGWTLPPPAGPPTALRSDRPD